MGNVEPTAGRESAETFDISSMLASAEDAAPFENAAAHPANRTSNSIPSPHIHIQDQDSLVPANHPKSLRSNADRPDPPEDPTRRGASEPENPTNQAAAGSDADMLQDLMASVELDSHENAAQRKPADRDVARDTGEHVETNEPSNARSRRGGAAVENGRRDLRDAVNAAIEDLQQEEPPERTETLKKRELEKLKQALSALDASNRPDLSVRRDALKTLGESRDARALALLEASSFAATPEERAAAAAALGDFEGPDAAAVLLRMLEDSKTSVLRVVVRALACCPSARLVKPLVRLAVEHDPLERDVLLALDAIGPPAVGEQVELMQHHDPRVVLVAVKSAGRIGNKAAVRSLLSVLEHADLEVRIAAAEALGAVGDKKAVGQLVRLLASPEAELRRAVVGALVAIPHPGAVSALVRVLADPVKGIRKRAIEALGAIGDAKAAGTLIDIFSKSEDDEISIAAVRALGARSGEGVTERLIAKLKLASPELSAAIAEALGRVGDPLAVPSLLTLIEETRSEVRFAAVTALGRIGHKSAAAGLCERLTHDREVRIRNAAAKALGNLQISNVAGHLEQAAREDSEVRCTAVISLGRLKNPSSVSVLHEMLADPAPDVRYQAAVALAAIGRRDAIHLITPLLDDVDPMVRRGADKSLKQLGDTGETWQRRFSRIARRQAGKLLPDFVFLLVPSSRGVLLGAGVVGIVLAVTAVIWLCRGITSASVPVSRGYVTSIAFTQNSDQLVVSRTNGGLEVWSISEGTPQSRLSVAQGAPIVYSNAINKVVIGAGAKPTTWTPGNAAPQLPASPQERVQACYLSGDETSAACTYANGRIRFFDLTTGRVEREFDLEPRFRGVLAVSRDFKYLATADLQGKVLLASAETGKLEDHADVANIGIQALTFAPDGDALVVVTIEGDVLVLPFGKRGSTERIEPAVKNQLTRSKVGSVVVSADGNSIALAYTSGAIALADRKAKTIEFVEGVDTEKIDTLTFSPDSKRLAFGGLRSFPVWIVDVVSRKVVATLDEK